ncbi:MAG: DNA polymerase III subunit delta [Deltaproteobacteria bacterium]
MKSKTQANITFAEFHKKLALGQIAPVYIFSGGQIYLIEQALARLKQKTLPGGAADFNFSLFWGDSVQPGEIVNAAKTSPMLSRTRLIAVKNSEKLPQSELKSIESYAKSPSPFACVVLISAEEKKLGFEGIAGVCAVGFRLDKRDLPQAVRGEAKALGFEISKEACQMLIDLVGESLLDIQSELMKICSFAAGREKIEAQDVRALTQRSQFEDVFALLGAVVERNKAKALRIVLDLERDGEEPLLILNTLSRRLALIWRAKELMDAKIEDAAALRELKVSPGAFYYIKQEAKKTSHANLKRAVELFYECDKMLKTGYAAKDVALTKVVLDLCR